MARLIVRKGSGGRMMGGVSLAWEGRTDARLMPAASFGEVGSGESRPILPPDLDGWCNVLIHADNLLVLSSLVENADALSACGGLSLIYIDPPYAMETDFHVGQQGVQGLAFRDSWGSAGAYLQFMLDRLVPMRSLLRD